MFKVETGYYNLDRAYYCVGLGSNSKCKSVADYHSSDCNLCSNYTRTQEAHCMSNVMVRTSNCNSK